MIACESSVACRAAVETPVRGGAPENARRRRYRLGPRQAKAAGTATTAAREAARSRGEEEVGDDDGGGEEEERDLHRDARYGEIWGDMGRCGEIWARSCGTVRSALTQQYNPGPESHGSTATVQHATNGIEQRTHTGDIARERAEAHLVSRGEHLLLAGVASVGEELSRARTGSTPSCEGDAYRSVPGRLVDGSWKGPTPGGEGDASDARAAEALLHPIARRAFVMVLSALC